MLVNGKILENLYNLSIFNDKFRLVLCFTVHFEYGIIYSNNRVLYKYFKYIMAKYKNKVILKLKYNIIVYTG